MSSLDESSRQSRRKTNIQWLVCFMITGVYELRNTEWFVPYFMETLQVLNTVLFITKTETNWMHVQKILFGLLLVKTAWHISDAQTLSRKKKMVVQWCNTKTTSLLKGFDPYKMQQTHSRSLGVQYLES